MNKRVFLIHGWGGAPEEGWRPWLAKELTGKADVYNLSMPSPDYPQVDEWVHFLTRAVNRPDENTYLIGHSLGCIAILRYLESLQDDEKVAAALFVAGFSDDLQVPELKNFFERQIRWDDIKKHADHFISIFSDNDPIVNSEKYSRVFKEKLSAEIVMSHNMLHFSGDDGIIEFPDLLSELQKLRVV